MPRNLVVTVALVVGLGWALAHVEPRAHVEPPRIGGLMSLHGTPPGRPCVGELTDPSYRRAPVSSEHGADLAVAWPEAREDWNGGAPIRWTCGWEGSRCVGCMPIDRNSVGVIVQRGQRLMLDLVPSYGVPWPMSKTEA